MDNKKWYLMISVPDEIDEGGMEEFLKTLGFKHYASGVGSTEYSGEGSIGDVRAAIEKAYSRKVARSITIKPMPGEGGRPLKNKEEHDKDYGPSTGQTREGFEDLLKKNQDVKEDEK